MPICTHACRAHRGDSFSILSLVVIFCPQEIPYSLYHSALNGCVVFFYSLLSTPFEGSAGSALSSCLRSYKAPLSSRCKKGNVFPGSILWGSWKDQIVLSAHLGVIVWVPYVHITLSKNSLKGFPVWEGLGRLGSEDSSRKVGSLGKPPSANRDILFPLTL